MPIDVKTLYNEHAEPIATQVTFETIVIHDFRKRAKAVIQAAEIERVMAALQKMIAEDRTKITLDP